MRLLPQFVVLIVIDGRGKMAKTVQEYCEQKLLLWDQNMVMMQHNNNDVTCHIFQRTARLPKRDNPNEYYEPIQLILAVKEKNGGKLNSHLWYFNAFARTLNPGMTFVRTP